MKGKFTYNVLRWLAGSLATMITLCVVGCQPVFISKEVYENAHSKLNMLPPAVEDPHNRINSPVTIGPKAPPTVDFPERRLRHMTLQEAIAHALENGLPSGRTTEGRGDLTMATFNGPGSLINQTDRLRVIALNPAITNAAMEASLSRFDAVWVSSMSWTNTDNLQQGLSSFNNGQGANFNSGIVKANADGSVTSFTMIANYTNLNTPPTGVFGVLNPQYTLRPSFGYEAPLWKDSGVEVNQLLQRLSPITGLLFNSNVAGLGFNAHQNTINNFPTGAPEGILISKLRFDQTRAEFERQVQTMVKNVEIAYWTLYSKYGQLYSFEENLRFLQKVYQENAIKVRAGAKDPKPYQFLQSKGQFQEFRANRTQALQEVLDAEVQLRIILGLAMEDGERIVPITPPTLAKFEPDWERSMEDALNLRPELVLARENLRYHQYLLAIQKNNLKPDLRFFARYEPVGFGNTLTGSGTFVDGTGTVRPTNAFESLRGLSFADYQFGFYLNVPIGQRAEHAAIRAARLQLGQAFYFVQDQEQKAIAYLTEQYQSVYHWYRRIEQHRLERKSYGDAMQSFMELVKGGQQTLGNPDLLFIQRLYAAALVKEYTAIAEYNNSLARLEWAKGSTLRYNNVYISEGALPECAQVSATQYERYRSRELVLKQRPDSLVPEQGPAQVPGRLVATREAEVVSELPPVNFIQEPGMLPAPEPVREPGRELQPTRGMSPFSPGVPDSTFDVKQVPEIKPIELNPVFTPAPKPMDRVPAPLPPAVREKVTTEGDIPAFLPIERPVDRGRMPMPAKPIDPLPIAVQPLPAPTPITLDLPPAPAPSGAVGFVTTERPTTLAVLAGPEASAREANVTSYLAPAPAPAINFQTRR
jgi:outer membrane protein TolC